MLHSSIKIYSLRLLKPMEDDLKKIFKIRDEAVASKDATAFKLTQAYENTSGGSVKGYFMNDNMETTLLYFEISEEREDEIIAFVKEKYSRGENYRFAYLVYYISKKLGNKITEIRY
jgi:hypothetical protein